MKVKAAHLWSMRERIEFVRMREVTPSWKKLAEHYGISVRRAKYFAQRFGSLMLHLRGFELLSMSRGPALPDDASVKELAMPRRVCGALICGGIYTVGQLTAMTPEEVFATPNIGKGSLLSIEKALANAGRSLR